MLFVKRLSDGVVFDSLQGNVLIVTQTAALRERINGSSFNSANTNLAGDLL